MLVLPVAVAFARSGVPVIGFDIDRKRVEELRAGHDRTLEVEPADLKQASLRFDHETSQLGRSGFLHCDRADADRWRAQAGSRRHIVGFRYGGQSVLKRGDIVVYESTVYPGSYRGRMSSRAREKASGLAGGRDFTVGYSPERINPGDQQHRFETIVKVVSAQDARTLDIVAEVYGSVVKAGIHRAPSIKVAEAAKVIENTQRDLNIAFMNELSAIFHQARHRYWRCTRRCVDQMEFPEFPAGACRRALHWR